MRYGRWGDKKGEIKEKRPKRTGVEQKSFCSVFGCFQKKPKDPPRKTRDQGDVTSQSCRDGVCQIVEVLPSLEEGKFDVLLVDRRPVEGSEGIIFLDRSDADLACHSLPDDIHPWTQGNPFPRCGMIEIHEILLWFLVVVSQNVICSYRNHVNTFFFSLNPVCLK